MKNVKLFVSCAVGALSFFSLKTAQAADHTVAMYYYNPNPGGGFYYFAPNTLSVPKGDTVTWVNADFYPYGGHTATSGSGGTPDGIWDSGLVANQGDHYTLSTAGLAPGTYPYFCTVDEIYNMSGSITVSAVVNNPPTVAITNVLAGARFRAPANITLQTSAADSDGSITNVQFFSGANSVANVTGAPFNFTMNNLAAGNYSFTAKAFDNTGATTTSAAVNIFVETNSMVTASASVSGGPFQFTLGGIAGQTYIIEMSSNLVNWTAVSTNVAPANVFSVTDLTAPTVLQRFYRARQDF